MMGDMIVLRFDKDWTFIDQHTLRPNAFFPTGTAIYGGNFFIAYTDVSKKSPKWTYRNVGLVAFDSNWNLLQDVAVTDYVNPPDTYVDGESPWLELYDNRLFVSYIESTLDPITGKGISGQAHMNVYKLIQKP